LQGEALKDYCRTKPAQWAIYYWDKLGMEAARRTLLAEQNNYVKNFGERVIGYGHFVSDHGRDTLGTSFFMQLHRWSNSFQKRATDYVRKCLQQFLCTGQGGRGAGSFVHSDFPFSCGKNEAGRAHWPCGA
jgi:hypothetical protein